LVGLQKAYVAYNAAAKADPDWGGKNEKVQTKHAERVLFNLWMTS
jgi:hypothetical protein